MKICTQCGQNLPDETAFCSNCGGSNFEPVADQQQASQQPNQQSYYQPPVQQPGNQQSGYQQPYQQAGASYQENNPAKGKATASLVLGIIGLVACWFGWGALLAIALAVVGMILGINARKEIPKGQPGHSLATAGMICSIIALGLSTIVFISCTLCVAALAGAGSSYGMFDYIY